MTQLIFVTKGHYAPFIDRVFDSSFPLLELSEGMMSWEIVPLVLSVSLSFTIKQQTGIEEKRPTHSSRFKNMHRNKHNISLH